MGKPCVRIVYAKAETKTSGRRSVDLPPSVMAELPGATLPVNPADGADRRPDDPSQEGSFFVWTMPRGGPLIHASFRHRYFVPAAITAGLGTVAINESTGQRHYEGPRIHDLRHTAVVLSIAAGSHPREIMEQLGHASISTTLNTYGHLLPDAGRQVAERLEKVRSDARRLRAV